MREIEREYQTVVLAALLHDIGKFYSRSKEVASSRRDAGYPGSHPIVSTLIVERNFASQLEKIGINTELLKKLIQHHHENPQFPSECLVNSLEGRERILAKIVSKADNYSSSERGEETSKTGWSYETTLLDSIFQRLDTGEGKSEGSFKIKPEVLSPENIFPESLEVGYWDKLVKGFGNDISNLNTKDFDSLFIVLLSIIQKYCWSTPSDITREVTDISLFDHLKTTSAIAACLYFYHQATDTLREDYISDESSNKFMFIGGDVSGIQRYIYDIAEVGVGGTAKRLRARSFKLTLLTEVAAHYILRKLGLPFSCLLFSVGGRFCILAPADEGSIKKFEAVREFIENWILKEFQGEISINLVSLPFSPEYFSSSLEIKENDKNFANLWSKFNALIEEAKLKKFYFAFQKDGLWNGNFLSETEFENSPEGVCRVCRKFPSFFQEEDFKVCAHCLNDKDLGVKLLKAKYLAFYTASSQNDANGDLSFFDECYVKVFEHSKEIYGNPYLVYALNSTDILFDFPCGFKFINNYVPVFRNKNELETKCQSCSFLSRCEAKYEIKSFPHTYTFQCIADSATGSKQLATLKADVDNLGFIVSNIPEISISRITTFSHMLDIFFSGYLSLLLDEKYPETYVVYSGGDDLLLIGPWDKTISLAKEISKKFTSFSCENPSLHLSSSVFLSKPKFPMANAAKYATDLIDEAKDKGRNRLNVFNTTFSWDSFDNLAEFAELLYSALEQKHVSSAFLYRLLSYQEMFNSYLAGDTNGLIYLSRLSYDIKRNLYNSQGKPKNERLIVFLEKLFKYKDEGRELMKNITFPISYAILKERGD